MELKVYNTQKKEKEIFTPLNDNQVSMYVCGMTVYDFAHLGHARAYTAFDVIYRFLKFSGYDVTYVRNITDIDDKIINRSREEIPEYQDNPRAACRKLSEKYTEEFHKDMKSMGLLNPDIEPKATTHINEIIKIIEDLIAKGHAYNKEGNVYFKINTFNDYGELSGREIENMPGHSRINSESDKEDPLDFALWKKHIGDEPYWESPFGKGRPGWHIECSAMSMKYLGENFDIHGGGQDLIFPHHENESAQSKAATDGNYARYWIHNGFITINQEKMSKSLKNFTTVRELLNKYAPADLKFYLLSTHYRSPLDFNDNLINQGKEALKKISDTLARAATYLNQEIHENGKPTEDFLKAMSDDFNTPKAIGAIFSEINSLNTMLASESDKTEVANKASEIFSMLNILGITVNTDTITEVYEDDWTEPSQAILKILDDDTHKLSDQDISDIVAARGFARKTKDFQLADKARDYLTSRKIIIRDGKGFTSWKKS